MKHSTTIATYIAGVAIAAIFITTSPAPSYAFGETDIDAIFTELGGEDVGGFVDLAPNSGKGNTGGRNGGGLGGKKETLKKKQNKCGTQSKPLTMAEMCNLCKTKKYKGCAGLWYVSMNATVQNKNCGSESVIADCGLGNTNR